ncbi:cell division protein ZapA [Liquorilactobacillus vini]|uniref:Cell division protein ZapA n=1 Tax=Liquorilactobacillus vini DSM 20605 TaxID=1133569 RepID=A0A0R2CAY5_9LACO|nr:cell division protein ZapA [Liquorilactobacillus vini]KRM88904.1 hypothetical protein FD21_GL000623 [Liquorilactobacillus vini DSM 20605]
MSEGKKRFKAQINGKSYVIVGNSSDEHLTAVVKVVNQQLKEIKRLMPSISDEKAAILLAINAVSDQLYKQAELLKYQQPHNQQSSNDKAGE